MNQTHTVATMVLMTAATAIVCSAAAASKVAPGQALFSSDTVPQIRIQVPSAEWEQLRRVNRTYVRATINVGTNEWRNVGIRLKGHGSFKPLESKPSLAVKFNEFVSGQAFDGLTKILLNNASQDMTLLSEYIAAGMFHDASVPAARVTHARVQLNSRDLGFYVVAEAMNKVFLRQHFKEASGNLYEVNAQDIDGQLAQSNGAPSDRSDIAALIAAARLPPAQCVQILPEVLDLDRFTSFLAVSILAAHHDSYPFNRNNYRLYREPDSKRFVMMPSGIDGSFSRISLPIQLPARYVLTKAIAETPAFEQACRERVRALFTNMFVLEKLTNRIDAAARRLQNAAANDAERAGLLTRADGFVRRVKERHRSVALQLAGINVTPLQLTFGATLPLTNWTSEVNRGEAALDYSVIEGRSALHIQTLTAESVASWRQRLPLAPGSYRFRANARFAQDGANPTATSQGLALRISGRSSPPRQTPAGVWTQLEFPFAIRDGEEDVQFVCECRGGNAQGWFELDSLILRKE
jgi:hypothetical protein